MYEIKVESLVGKNSKFEFNIFGICAKENKVFNHLQQYFAYIKRQWIGKEGVDVMFYFQMFVLVANDINVLYCHFIFYA